MIVTDGLSFRRRKEASAGAARRPFKTERLRDTPCLSGPGLGEWGLSGFGASLLQGRALRRNRRGGASLPHGFRVDGRGSVPGGANAPGALRLLPSGLQRARVRAGAGSGRAPSGKRFLAPWEHVGGPVMARSCGGRFHSLPRARGVPESGTPSGGGKGRRAATRPRGT